MLSKPFHEEINRAKRPCGPHKTASWAKCGPRATGWAALYLVPNNNQTAVISKASRAKVDTEGYFDDHQLPIIAQVTFTQNLEIGG